jgi:hypothetical protein
MKQFRARLIIQLGDNVFSNPDCPSDISETTIAATTTAIEIIRLGTTKY